MTRAAANRKKALDPVYQETRRKMNARPEFKANQAAGARRRWQDPEFRKKVSAGKKRARALRDAAKTNA